MTKKDYELIAGRIKANLSYSETIAEEEVIRKLAFNLSHDLEENDPKFKRDSFLEACGVLEYARSDVDEDGNEVVTYRPS